MRTCFNSRRDLRGIGKTGVETTISLSYLAFNVKVKRHVVSDDFQTIRRSSVTKIAGLNKSEAL